MKKVVFSFITIVVIPLLFFVLLEVGLRVAGVGNSFDYFYEIDIEGEPHYQENPEFANQFYPASLNIGPMENTFTVERGADLVRVYVLGGSAAQGFPHKNHGFDRFLATQLRAALPGKRIEVINTAMTSVNSHVMYAVAKSIPDDSADFAVILMGNNEVVGPYGPGTFNQNFLGNLSVIRGIQALKRTRIWQALDSLIMRVSSTDAMEELEWEGMQMFANNGVPHDDPRMESVYAHYEDNLAEIINTLGNKGMHVLVSSVPVNLRHSAPFLSLRDEGASSEQVNRWRELTQSGAKSAAEENWEAAAAHFRAALEIDPDYADTHFRLATALENLGQHENAGTHYGRALDLDALRFRADSRINRIIEEVAGDEANDEVSFVDTAAAFEQASEPYQPGWNLLLEHVHYGFSGNHIVAAELSRSIVNKLKGSDDFEPLPADEVARRTGSPNFDTIGEIQNLLGMIEQPPFPGQSNYVDLRNFLEDTLENVKNEVGTTREVVERRQDVVSSGLADWKLHFELAVLNQRLRNPPAMYRHLDKIFELYPHNRESYIKIAEAMNREGKWSEAIPYLERSLYYTRGDEEKIAQSMGWLGAAHLRTGNYDKGSELLLTVVDRYPDQIDLALKAYGNLIKYAREQGKKNDLDRYIRDVQRYAGSLIRQGKDEEYPLLYTRMSQLMTMGGYTAEAQEWAAKGGQ